MSNGYFPGKKKAQRSGIITPRTAQETQIAAMPRVSGEARQALREAPPLSVGGADLAASEGGVITVTVGDTDFDVTLLDTDTMA
ncbi:MAG: hypothetical protein ACTS5Y_00910, partial [Pollutimonas bauzanensis]